jgi:hypothetical protein
MNALRSRFRRFRPPSADTNSDLLTTSRAAVRSPSWSSGPAEGAEQPTWDARILSRPRELAGVDRVEA